MKLSSTDRKALAILGQRRPICDMGKDKYREVIHNLIRNDSGMARYTLGGWEITELGRASMGKVRGGVWCKWAERFKVGGAKLMADALNSGGCDAGHLLLDELRAERDRNLKLERS
tara:strand:- start:6256 stop:6603 length:348 start_codon:yes stop_codon:yes gene_type:complete